MTERKIYAVTAFGRRGVRLHTSYVRSASQIAATFWGRQNLKTLCGVRPFEVRARVATPAELGMVELPKGLFV